MAYKIGGKMYTDHALLDQIVYQCKKILSSIVIKNDELANYYESETSVSQAEALKLIEEGLATFENFPFTAEELKACGYTSAEIARILDDKFSVPVEDREQVLETSTQYFKDNFVEENKYYRTLIGLPPLAVEGLIEDDYTIPYYTTGKKFGYSEVLPQYFIDARTIDTTLSLHEQTKEVIDMIQNTKGALETLRENYKGSNFSYINFLGDKRLDLYTCRKAPKWDILYMPKVDELVEERFVEIYKLNRELYLKQSYQEAYKYESDYYDQILIVSLLCQTFTDMVVDVPEWYIRRDIFDIRSVQYFLESYGVQFFPQIPLKYQIRIVKRLNRLIKYKSSNVNVQDILDIFDSKDTKIYKYYLYKKRLVKDKKYVTSGANNKDYELEFIMSELEDSYDNYIKENIYRKMYDDVTYYDKYWDGENSHSVVRDRILAKDFTIQGTKYMAVDFNVSMSEYLDQIAFLVGLIIDSGTDIDDFKVLVPTISEFSEIGVSDLFLFMMAISDLYEGKEQTINLPPDSEYPWTLPDRDWWHKYYTHIDGGYYNTPEEDFVKVIQSKSKAREIAKFKGTVWQLGANGGNGIEISEVRTNEQLLDWKKKYYGKKYLQRRNRYINPGMYEVGTNFTLGFNNVDMDKLAEIIGQRHSRFGFERGYTLEELGIDGYINPSSVDIKNGSDLYDLYINNIDIYHQLKERLTGRLYSDDDINTIKASDEDQYRVIEYVIKTLFTKKLDYNKYKLPDGTYAKKLSDVLMAKNFVLYDRYLSILNENNIEAQQELIRNTTNDIINVLEYYITGPGVEYVFNFSAIVSFDSLLRYILMLVNFFKSYKVQFLDPFVVYRLDDYMDNSVAPIDGFVNIEEEYENKDYYTHDESIAIQEYSAFEDNVLSESAEEALSIAAHFDPDPDDDYDYDGQNPEDGTPVKEADGRYPDDKSQYPYIMLNGGTSYLGRLAAWDLDGANPKDYEDEFIDIDGGYAYHLTDDRKDWFGIQGFNYIIDGGTTGTSGFRSKTMRVIIKDEQVTADVLISNAIYNRLELKEDGLYLEDIWEDYDDFTQWINETDGALRGDRDYLESAEERLVNIADLSEIEEFVHRTVTGYTHNMRRVIDVVDSDAIFKRAKAEVDQQVENMHNDYDDFSALGWWNEI